MSAARRSNRRWLWRWRTRARGWHELRATLQARRDRLAAGLIDIGFEVHDSAGTYFLCADPRPLGYDDSTAFCAALPERVGVAAIPMSAFCDPEAAHGPADVWNHLVRFTFCKRDDTLDEAIRRLAAQVFVEGLPTPAGVPGVADCGGERTFR